MTNGYQYDLLGRLSTVEAGSALAASYGFDMVGNLQSVRYANGVTNLYQYDSRNRLTNLAWQQGGAALASFGYTVGPTGNRTALTEAVNATSRTYNWAYDYLYRMKGETFAGAGYPGPQSITYGFDAVGNRTNRTAGVLGINNQVAAYTANDWLASDAQDPNGNTTVSGTANYQYDALNHLTNVNNGHILVTYDGDGHRVSKTIGHGATTYYLVDDRNPSGYAQVLEEYQGATLSRVYNYGLALISQRQVSSGTVSYYGTDGHGSTRFLSDGNGNITDTYAFDAYGLLISSTGTTPNNYLYCGQQWDGDLGFYYLRARYYKPDSGRFWTIDTYGGDSEDPLSLHKYLYCQNNPVMGFDPSGHEDLASLNITMAQMAVFAIKVYNTTVNVKAAVANFSNGYTAMQDGRDFDAAIDFSMACVNATFAISSAVAPLPPGAGPGLAAAGVGGRAQAIKIICANPKLEQWFAQNAVTYVNGTAAGLLGMFVAMNQNNSSSGGQASQGGSSGSSSGGPEFIPPGTMKIGFMTRDGKLIGGKLWPARLGHDMLASQLGVTSQAQSGSVLGIRVGKTSDGSINAFGSGTFGPLTAAQKAMAAQLGK